MKVVIISLIIILITICAVSLILGFENIRIIRYNTYFQPVIDKEFIIQPTFLLSRIYENQTIVPVSLSYDISQTLYFFEGYGVIVPNDLTLLEYFNTNDTLISDLVPISNTNVFVNSHKRYDDELPSIALYNDFILTNNIQVIIRHNNGFYNVSIYRALGDIGYSVPLDIINIIQPFNSAVSLNDYDKPVLDNSEGGVNGIFKTLDYIFIEYPAYLYNYVDRYLTFI